MLINCFSKLSTGGRTIVSDLSFVGFLREGRGRMVCVRLLRDSRCLVLCNISNQRSFFQSFTLSLIFLGIVLFFFGYLYLSYIDQKYFKSLWPFIQ